MHDCFFAICLNMKTKIQNSELKPNNFPYPLSLNILVGLCYNKKYSEDYSLLGDSTEYYLQFLVALSSSCPHLEDDFIHRRPSSACDCVDRHHQELCAERGHFAFHADGVLCCSWILHLWI